jgi:hypothetical protein
MAIEISLAAFRAAFPVTPSGRLLSHHGAVSPLLQSAVTAMPQVITHVAPWWY